jgi:DNA polymerase-1
LLNSSRRKINCCSLATERGISVCAPVHDAILIEAPLDRLEKDVARTQQAMREASAAVLGGFELRSDAKLVRFPEHYTDERGEAMWSLVWGLVEEASQKSNRRQLPVFRSEPQLSTSEQPLFASE